MKNVEYTIVGGGYAALFFAHQLIKNNKFFVLFSDGKKSASQVSAGIVNPMVLKKFTTFWLAQEQLDRLNETLNEIEKYTGNHYLIKENIHRIFHDQKELVFLVFLSRSSCFNSQLGIPAIRLNRKPNLFRLFRYLSPKILNRF